MGFNSPGMLAKLWTSQSVILESNAPWWQSNSAIVNTTVAGATVVNGTYANGTIADATIRQVLGDNMRHAIYTTSIAAIVGSVVFIGTVHLLCRRRMLIGSFFGLAVLLAIAAAVMRPLFHDGSAGAQPLPGGHVGLIFLWIVIQFFFSFGPNTLTFIVSRHFCFYALVFSNSESGTVCSFR